MFNCKIFLRRKVVEWIPAADNLRRIREFGLGSWLKEQEERQGLLEGLLQHYNEGRSMNVYCKVCARMPIDLINKIIKQAKEKLRNEKIDQSDVRLKARVLRAVIKDLASEVNISLK